MSGQAGRRQFRNSRFFWLALALSVLALGAHAVAVAALLQHAHDNRHPGFWLALKAEGWYVSRAEGTAGAVQPGDRIVAVNNTPARIDISPIRQLSSCQVCTLRIQRGGRVQYVEMKIAEQRYRGRAATVASLLFSVFSFYVLSLAVLLKPRERIFQVGFLAATAMSLALLGDSLAPLEFVLSDREYAVFSLMRALPPIPVILGYDFFSRFPPGVAPGRFWTRLRLGFYLAGAALAVLALPVVLGALGVPTSPYGTPVLLHSRLFLSWLIDFCCAVAACAVIVHNYGRVKNPDQRRRIKWVAYALAATFVPTCIDDIQTISGALAGQPLVPFGRLTLVANLTAMLIPLALGYTLLKHRVLGTRVVLRLGLQYLLAKSVLRLLVFLPAGALAVTLYINADRPVTDVVLGSYYSLALLGAAALSLKFRTQVAAWLDRRFFREAYDQEQILQTLIVRIRELDSMSDTARLVTGEIDKALHPSRVLVMYREAETSGLKLGYSSGESLPSRVLPADARLLQVLAERARACDFPLRGREALPASEHEWLEAVGTRLMVPAFANDSVVALLLLGEKKSEEPYTMRDRGLLEAVAAHMAMAYENALLKDKVSQEQRTRREVLARLGGQRDLMRECPSCGSCFDGEDEVCPRDGSELTVALPIGRVVAEKYRLNRRLGRGGMGAVYEAADLRLQRKVAVKLMMGGLMGNRAALRRFEREARAAASLSHPNIVAIFDFGSIGGDGAYLVMELLHGATWRAELNRSGAFSPAVAAPRTAQLLEGVRAAHGFGRLGKQTGSIRRGGPTDPGFQAIASGAPICIRCGYFGTTHNRHRISLLGGCILPGGVAKTRDIGISPVL